MGFYSPAENPSVMIRENLNTKSSEYIIISQDDLYIASITPEEIFHILQDKFYPSPKSFWSCTHVNSCR